MRKLICGAWAFCMVLVGSGTLCAQDVSNPGVVKRQAPENTQPVPNNNNDGPAAPTVDQTAIDFGDTEKFDNNFGPDFDVRKMPKNVKITLDFRDAELSDVVKLMSAQTGRNFIVADSLRTGKKITIISPNPVTPAEAFKAFLSALQMNGLTIVKSGDFYKILDMSAATREPMTLSEGYIPRNDALVTHIFKLEHVDVSEVKPVIDQLKTTSGMIIDYSPGNSIIVTDTGNSVARIASFLKQVDTSNADGDKLWVYQVQHAEAKDMERILTQVFQVNKRSNSNNNNNTGDQVRLAQIVADERTNRLIIVADSRSYEKVKRLMLKLDIEIADSSRINVLHLQNADASELSSNLYGLLNAMQDGKGGGSNNNSGGSLLQGQVSIVPNVGTNDLVIVGSPRDFLSLKSVIRELDRPRRQVFVEAVIMEVSIERSRELGIVLHGGDSFSSDKGDSYLVGRTELNGMQSLSPAAMFLGGSSAPGLLAGLVGPTLEIGGLKLPAVGMFLKALQTNTDVNVLSTPTLLTLDNEEATISVGERIPYITNTGGGISNLAGLASSALGNNGTANAASALGGYSGLLGGYGTQISRVDIALTVRIKPQINENGSVRLTIDEQIEEVKPGGSDLGGPTTRMRNLQTVVVVPDQQTVVLGGLVRDSESQSVSKIPLLGDIPVLGYLFRSTDKKLQKQNLLMMLTPYVIESNEDLEKIRIRKEKEREQFLEFFGRKDLNYVRSVNYDKKNGIIEAMRKSIDNKELELNAVKEAQDSVRYVPEEDSIDLPDGFSSGYEKGKKSSTKRRRNHRIY